MVYISTFLLLFSTGGCKQTQSLSEPSSQTKIEQSSETKVLSETAQTTTTVQKGDLSIQTKKLTLWDLVNPKQNQELQLNHLVNGYLYLQTIDKEVSWLFPTISQYVYDIQDNELREIKKRNSQEDIRVWDFIEKDGKLYESLIYLQNNTLVAEITSDGTSLWKGIISDASRAPKLGIQDGEIFFLSMSMDSQNENTEKATFWRLDSTGTLNKEWDSSELGNSVRIISFTLFRDDYSDVAFLTESENGKEIHYYSDGKICSQVFNGDSGRLVPTDEGIIIASNDLSTPQDMKYSLFSYADQSLKQINSNDRSIGQRNIGSPKNNIFLYLDIDHNTNVAFLENETITALPVEIIPEGISDFWRISDTEYLLQVKQYSLAKDQLEQRPEYYLVDIQR